MFYTIYRTTNTITGKYYIGKHQTEKANDDYLGSGSALKAAIKKYGKASFIKEVLFVFDNELDMNLKEKELITEELVSDKNSYNKGVGGEGGPHFRGKKHTVESRKKFARPGKKLTDQHKIKISEANRKRGPLSNETKEKISEKQKNRWQKEKKMV